MEKVRTVYILIRAYVDWLSFLKYKELKTGSKVALVNREWTEKRSEKMRTKEIEGVSLAEREEDKDAEARSPGAVGGRGVYKPSEREPFCPLYLTALPPSRGLAALPLLPSLFFWHH